jgi:uncharacterized protein with von Willebrand factor type A (vWA) domain
MFATFFHELKQAGVPVTLREYLTLMEAIEKDLAGRRIMPNAVRGARARRRRRHVARRV